MRRCWKLLVGMLLCLASASIGLADGVMRDGSGAIAIGRGGTNIAHADNAEILLDNPAGMINVEGQGLFEAGGDLLFTDLHYSDLDNPRTGAKDHPFPLGQVGWVRKSPDGQWAAGVGVFTPAGFAAEYDMNGPFPLLGTRNYKSLGALGKVLPGVAYQVTDRLSIGATLGVGISHVELEGPYFLQSAGPLRGTPMMLDLIASGAAITWSTGFQYRLTDATTLGLTYQSENRFHLTGSTAADVPLLGHSGFDTRFDITWPQSLGLGLRHELCPHRVVSLDVMWFDWSQAFDHFGIQFSNPDNPVFAALVGPRFSERVPLDWQDTVSVRVGYEMYLPADRVLRFGYAYHRNPIPLGTQSPYIQAILEHAFSVGYGWQWRAWQMDLAYQFSFGPNRTAGLSDFAGGDFNFSRVESEAHFLCLSLLRRF